MISTPFTSDSIVVRRSRTTAESSTTNTFRVFLAAFISRDLIKKGKGIHGKNGLEYRRKTYFFVGFRASIAVGDSPTRVEWDNGDVRFF
jgi:hypothetical protein